MLTPKHILRLIIALISVVITGSSVRADLEPAIYITAVAWNSDGSKVAAVGINSETIVGFLQVTDVATGEVQFTLEPNPGGFASVVWSPDDRYLAAGSYDQTIHVIQVADGKFIAQLPGHRATVTSVDWSPDGQRLVSVGTHDRQVILWDMRTYQPAYVLERGDPWAVEFSPDGQQIAVGGMGGLRVYPATLEGEAKSFSDRYIASLKWSADGNQIAFGNFSFQSVTQPELQPIAQLGIVDSRSGALVHNIPVAGQTIYGLDWSQDGRLIATYNIDGAVQVWDVASERLLETLEGTTKYGVDLQFSPFGGRLAYGLTIDPAQARGATTAPQGIAIVVPAAAEERLQAIAQQCDAPVRLTAELDSFRTQVARMSAEIAPGCAADLLAVAAAMDEQR